MKAGHDRLTGPAKRLVIDGVEVPVSFRRNARARRLILRIAPDGSGVMVTLPGRVSERTGLDFAERHADWIRPRLAAASDRVAFAPGQVIPYRGEPHTIVWVDRLRGVVRAQETEAGRQLLVPGDPAHLPRRLTDWLKRQARGELISASRHYAAAMGANFKTITIRDQRSRWGSCSSGGRLSYSWRLILAPPYVLDYLAAHEVAHLIEMNHGDRFWGLVRAHCPETDKARNWLKRHGASLHRYGAPGI